MSVQRVGVGRERRTRAAVHEQSTLLEELSGHTV